MKRGLGLFAAALLLAAPAVWARELHWSAFSVKARLDAEGTLRIVETQTIVFSGDWNGGYRTFRLGPGQTLDFQAISRIEPAAGRPVFLTRGNLDAVDHFDWSDARTIRWRSRLPSDPPFDSTAITYRLDYSVSGVLKADGEIYRLDHDFAFPDRESRIEHFTLDLELDPAWEAPEGFPTRPERSDLPAGRGVVVTAGLTHRGAGRPVVVRIMSSRTWRVLLLALLVFVVALLFRFRQWEAASGRYRPLLAPSEISPTWLQENLFHWKAEEAGAAWDDQVGAPEVAAFLARLVGEGKIRSRVEVDKGLLSSKQVLHLELKAPRTGFSGHERELIGKIFFDGDQTDTESIRQHYAKTGFDPAQILRDPLLARTAEGAGTNRVTPRWEKLPPALLGVLGLVSGAVACRVPQNVAFVVLCFAGMLVAFLVATGLGALLTRGWRSRYGPALDGKLPLFLVPPALLLALPVYLANQHLRLPAGTFLDPPASIVLSIACLGLAACMAYFLRLRSADSPELVDRRRKLASARAFFEAELEKPTPALHDGWYPYIVSFGLDKEADRWFHRFGGAAAGSQFSGHESSTSGASTSSSSSWSGGGGSFGGAGASVGWGVAAAGIAGGVTAASSGSSGGGGGGSSSGGGGGGGW